MKQSLHISVLLLLVTRAFCANDDRTLYLPRIPPPEFAYQVAQGVPLTQWDVRQILLTFLPRESILVQDVATPANGSSIEDSDLHRGEPHTVAASLGLRPVIDFADTRYAPLSHTGIPVLLDWFEAMASALGTTPAQMRAAGYRCNKVARLMRVFTEIRMHRDHRRDPGMAPAIGWCRILLQEDWGRCLKGETHSFVLVGTERGWFVLDPFTRRLRQMEKNDPRWVVEFVVL